MPTFFRAFEFAARVARSTSTPTDSVARVNETGIKSPWSSDSLSKVVWSDVFGTPLTKIERKHAMKVPALVKGRALICGTLSRQPLAKFRGETKVAPEAWMYRTNTQQAPQVRMLWTIDDLIWSGCSLWAVQRGARDVILDAIRVPPEWWEVDDDLRILVNGQPVSAEEVVLIEGPQDGLLTIAADDIRAALAMAKSWADRVEHPLPPTHLETTDPQVQMEPHEVRKLVDDWDEARARGGSAYTPYGMRANYPQTATSDLYVAGRNAARLDFANFLALPASLLEGSTATASLTYSTKEGARNELVDYSLSYWATPIEARLSQDDVVPAGNRTAFDLEYLSTPNQPVQGPASED